MQTRETFAGLSDWQIALWYALIAVSTAIFAWGVVRLVLKYRRGRGNFPTDQPGRRVARTAWIVLTHVWIKRRDGVAGLAHALIFYGFVVLFIGTSILAFQDDFAKPVLGWDFWRGPFYLGYSLFLDVFGAGLVVGLLIMAAKRGSRPARLDYGRVDGVASRYERWRYEVGDWAFVGSLLFLGVTGFLLEALRIAETDPSFEKWAPIGWLTGQGLRAIGIDGHTAADAHFRTWWVHGIAALTFVAAIPFTKAVHMLSGPASVATRDDMAGKRLVELPAGATAEEVGYGVVADLTPAHLLQLDACTKCGKCHEACPAAASGYPLSPRDLILDLREQAEGTFGVRAALGVQPLFASDANLLGNPIRPETVWSCMQCMACVEICPVGIEHVPIINNLRRRLVDAGELDSQLQSTLETIYESGNSFGEPKRKRGRWAKELDFDVKDARKEPVTFSGSSATTRPSIHATSASHRRSPASCTTRRWTSGSSTRASAMPATMCAGAVKKGSSPISPRAISRRSRRASSSAFSRPTRTRSTRSRTSTRPSGARGTSSTTRSCCSSCSRRVRSRRAGSSNVASPTTTPARSDATTGSTTSRAG